MSFCHFFVLFPLTKVDVCVIALFWYVLESQMFPQSKWWW